MPGPASTTPQISEITPSSSTKRSHFKLAGYLGIHEQSFKHQFLRPLLSEPLLIELHECSVGRREDNWVNISGCVMKSLVKKFCHDNKTTMSWKCAHWTSHKAHKMFTDAWANPKVLPDPANPKHWAPAHWAPAFWALGQHSSASRGYQQARLH